MTFHLILFITGTTGLHYVPVSNWTMEVQGSQKIPIVGLDDKRQVTAVFAGLFCFIG